MTNPSMARCGIDCAACEFRKQMNCPGCHATEGKPFWGACTLALCSMEKGHDHCGHCQQFPCDTLTEFASDPEHGDQGARIRNLEAWSAKE